MPSSRARPPTPRPPARRSWPGSANAPTTCSASLGPFGLEVDPADQPAVEQERPDVVAEFALRPRCVDLDAIPEVEQPLDARPEEDQRIERAQQRRAAVAARTSPGPPQIRRCASSRRPRRAPVRRRPPARRSRACSVSGRAGSSPGCRSRCRHRARAPPAARAPARPRRRRPHGPPPRAATPARSGRSAARTRRGSPWSARPRRTSASATHLVSPGPTTDPFGRVARTPGAPRSALPSTARARPMQRRCPRPAAVAS